MKSKLARLVLPILLGIGASFFHTMGIQRVLKPRPFARLTSDVQQGAKFDANAFELVHLRSDYRNLHRTLVPFDDLRTLVETRASRPLAKGALLTYGDWQSTEPALLEDGFQLTLEESQLPDFSVYADDQVSFLLKTEAGFKRTGRFKVLRVFPRNSVSSQDPKIRFAVQLDFMPEGTLTPESEVLVNSANSDGIVSATRHGDRLISPDSQASL